MNDLTKTSYRMSAKAVLGRMIQRQEGEVAALKLLAELIPWDKIRGEDEAKLWSYFIRSD